MWYLWAMKPISYARHRFPPDVIRHAVWLYLRFTLSYRDVEDLLAERGLIVSNESIRRWVLKFGPVIAKNLRTSRPQAYTRWHLDEMVVKQGEALSPEREPLTVLNALKLQIGSDAFSAQYQQAPAPPGGAMVKRAWIRRFAELPPSPERLFTLQSWDTASKGGPENDWSVCTTWIVARKKQWYLVDMWRGRVDYP